MSKKSNRATAEQLAACYQAADDLFRAGATTGEIRRRCFDVVGVIPSTPTISRHRRTVGVATLGKFPELSRPFQDPALAQDRELYERANRLMNLAFPAAQAQGREA